MVPIFSLYFPSCRNHEIKLKTYCLLSFGVVVTYSFGPGYNLLNYLTWFIFKKLRKPVFLTGHRMRSSSGTGQRDHDSSSLPRFTSFSNTQIPGLNNISYFFIVKGVVLIKQEFLSSPYFLNRLLIRILKFNYISQ